MTKIEWCDLTLNPVVGCSKCSPGCLNCYAERFAARMTKNPLTASKYAGVVDEKGKWTGKLSLKGWGCLDTLPENSPKRVFLGSMTDIFHENMGFMDFEELCDCMEFRWPQHTFLLLTKRPERAKEFIELKPLPKNVWLGVTVCNQKEANEKLPILMKIPAAKRFVSLEPMLEPVNLWHICSDINIEANVLTGVYRWSVKETLESPGGEQIFPNGPQLDWVICGGETGPRARPMHPDWARSLRDQCNNAAVPFFFKSWGEWLPCTQMPDDMDVSKYKDGDIGDDGIFIPPPALEIPMRNGVCHEQVFRVGKKLAGRLLDGQEWNEIPVQENNNACGAP